MEKKLSYEEAIAQIEAIMNRFKEGNMSVDELSENAKKATELISYCKERLHSTEEDLKRVME